LYKATTRVFGGDEMGIDNIEIEKIIEILIANFNPYLIYFFGSVLTDNFREDSDIDIAFLSDSKISDYDVFIIAQNIADIVNRDVDLINLKNSSTVFKAQVIGNGKVIFCNDNNRRMFFEMRSFKEYTLLNEERQVILDNIKKRGSVYGK
jgi:predicted nucleotidyltransferase